MSLAPVACWNVSRATGSLSLVFAASRGCDSRPVCLPAAVVASASTRQTYGPQ